MGAGGGGDDDDTYYIKASLQIIIIFTKYKLLKIKK